MIRRARPITTLILVAASLSGCGPRPALGPAVEAPHRGVLLRLPEDFGYAEILVEPDRTPKSGRTELVAYFLGPDAKSPLDPAPSHVSLDLYLAEPKARSASTLKSAPRPGDKSGAARFAAATPEGFDGNISTPRLSAKVAGKDVQAP